MVNVIKNITAAVFLVSLAFGAITFTNGINSAKSYSQQISQMKGKVIGFDGSLLAIEFDQPIIKPTGDTEINTFLVDSNGSSIQLKPITIPEKKAKGLSESKVLVFPVSDILSLLEPKVYAIEVFVKNNSSIFHSGSVQLPLIPLDLSGATEEKIEDVQV